MRTSICSVYIYTVFTQVLLQMMPLLLLMPLLSMLVFARFFCRMLGLCFCVLGSRGSPAKWVCVATVYLSVCLGEQKMKRENKIFEPA